MNPPTILAPDSALDDRAVTPPSAASTRPFYWSVRRELWEYRSLYVAPLAVTALVLLASLVSLAGLPHRLQSLAADDPARRLALLLRPYGMAPAPIMLSTILVGLFYALDALYGERRDRSFLFWKSLPVSDRTTVLAKASIPFVVLPAVAFALSLATRLVILLLTTLVLLACDVSVAALWSEVRLLEETLIMLYGLAVHALWFAPIYGWLLLVSAWARRLPLLWAALPPFAMAIVEGIATGGSSFASLLKYRVTGAMATAFGFEPGQGASGEIDRLSQLTPARFLSAPGLWIGLAFAAACLAAAIRVRRRRDPI